MALNQLGLGFLFTATDAASGVMKQVRNGFNQTRDEAGKFGSRSKSAFKEFAVGAGLMAAGLSGLAILGSTIDDAAEFGKAINLVRTEVDEATFSNQEMRDITIDLGKEFGKMPKDEAEALYKAVALGANTAAKATDLMRAANQLAVAGNADLKTTMDAVGGAINAYGLKASDASMVSDAFFTAMKGGNTTVQDLASSVGRVSAGAHAMGISVQEVLGSVAVMTNKGIQASEAVSYLHGALANITHPSHDAMVEAQRLGIQFNASAVRAQGFNKFLHSITDNAKFNAKSLEKLFTSVEGSQAMAMLAGDMGNVDAMMKNMREGAGATKAGFDIMAGGLSFQSDKLKANFSALKIRVGEFLEPLAARGLQTINRLMDAFTNLPGPVQRTIVSIAIGAASLVTLVGGVAAGIAAFKIFGAALMTFGGGAIGTFVAALLPAIALIGVFAAAFYALKHAYETNLGGIASRFDGLVDTIKTAWKALTELFSTGTLDAELTQELINGDNAAVNFAVKIKQIADEVVEFFSQLAHGFTAGIDEAKPVFDAFSKALDELSTAFGGLVGPVDDVDAGFGAAGEAGSKTGRIVAKLATIIVDALTIAMKIVTGFVNAWGMVSDAFAETGGAFHEVGAAISEIVTILSEAMGGSAEATSGWQILGQVLAGIVAVAVRLVGSQISMVADMLRNFAQVASGVVDIVAGIFTGKWGRVWKGVREVVSGVVASIIDSVLSMVQMVADAADAIGKAFGKDIGAGKALKEFRAGAKEFVKGAMGLPHTEAATEPVAVAQTAFTAVPGAGLATPAAAPAVASVAPGGPGIDTDAAIAAASAASRAAMASLPPTQVNATLVVDGEVLGRMAMKGNASDASRSNASTPVDVGGNY